MANIGNLTRNTLLLFYSLLIATACNNDETNSFIENSPVIKHKGTGARASTYKTWGEVERRLDELNAKYDVKWMLNYEQSVEAFDEEYFIFLEKLTRSELGLDTIITDTGVIIE